MDLTLVALIITAVATAVLAVLTGVLAWQNRMVVSAAEQEIAEIQRDRELGSQPILSFRITDQALAIVNFGRGPAINVIGAYHEGDRWSATKEPIDLAPNTPVTATIVAGSGPPPDAQRILNYRMPDGRPGAMFCQDQLGHGYRFGSHKVAPDIWRPGTEMPEWMTWYVRHLP